MKYKKGYTLIELLVVVAIIGILASVVIASLKHVRMKGQVAIIKSSLSNMMLRAEQSYNTAGNYSLVCSDTKITSMLNDITKAGGKASCYSHNNPSIPDVNTRWGAAGYLNSDHTQNFSSSQDGFGIFDTSYPDTQMTWIAASTFCSSKGGRLPSIEELKSLWLAYGTYYIPSDTGFATSGQYWSGTSLPNPIYAQYIDMGGGYIYGDNKATRSYYVRCVH